MSRKRNQNKDKKDKLGARKPENTIADSANLGSGNLADANQAKIKEQKSKNTPRKKSKILSAQSSSSMVRSRYLASRLFKRFENIILLTRINKPVGIFLLMWPTLTAILIASKGQPGLLIPVVFIAGVILMRSAGCAINDFADRKFDGRVQRTKDRPLANGKAKPLTAVLIFIVLSLVAFALVVRFLNEQVMYLSLVAVAIVFVYPFAKRYTHLPQIVLGAAFAMAVPMAFVAYGEELSLECWLLFSSTVLWATGYDTMYALVDKADDEKIGVKSTAILFGDTYRTIIAIIYVLVLFALLLAADLADIISIPFMIGLAVAALLNGYQLYLISDSEPKRCFRAFMNNNWYGAAIFLGVLYHYLLEDGKALTWWGWLLSLYIVSIVLVYNLGLLKKTNRAFWVFVACVLGPLAIPLALFA